MQLAFKNLRTVQQSLPINFKHFNQVLDGAGSKHDQPKSKQQQGNKTKVKHLKIVFTESLDSRAS